MDPPEAPDPGRQLSQPRGEQHREARPARPGDGDPAGDISQQRKVEEGKLLNEVCPQKLEAHGTNSEQYWSTNVCVWFHLQAGCI